MANVYIGEPHKSMAIRPTSSAVTLSSRLLSRQRSFIPMRTLPIRVDLVTLVPGSSRPELPSAHVTNWPALGVAAPRNLDSIEPGMSSSNMLQKFILLCTES